MKLYFKETELSYREISELLTTHIGPAGPDTWQNGTDMGPDDTYEAEGWRGYVEIYNDHPGACFVRLKW